jgi:flagellar basal-body rod protein FlgB
MLIDELSNSGAIPALEMTLRFAGARQRLLAHNVANLSTPDFRPVDVSPEGFQKMLREAVEKRSERTGVEGGELPWRPTREIRRAEPGSGTEIELRPATPSKNILFHDRNNRDMERTMQDLAENMGVYRVASDLLRTRFDLLRSAIAERA